jgi:hypothetical protein
MSARDQVLALRKRIGESFIGQEHIIERLLIGVLSNGNLLVEGCPDWRDARGGRSRRCSGTREGHCSRDPEFMQALEQRRCRRSTLPITKAAFIRSQADHP